MRSWVSKDAYSINIYFDYSPNRSQFIGTDLLCNLLVNSISELLLQIFKGIYQVVKESLKL